MPSPRVVLDTNVIVSAHLKEDGIERLIVNLALSGHLNLYVSAEILEEYEDVLLRPKFKLPKGLVTESLALIHAKARMARPTVRVEAATDADDNKFLECAEAANAAFLVTGNLKHFPMEWKGTIVLNARRLIDEIL